MLIVADDNSIIQEAFLQRSWDKGVPARLVLKLRRGARGSSKQFITFVLDALLAQDR